VRILERSTTKSLRLTVRGGCARGESAAGVADPNADPSDAAVGDSTVRDAGRAAESIDCAKADAAPDIPRIDSDARGFAKPDVVAGEIARARE
jgi:hypothetical protein